MFELVFHCPWEPMSWRRSELCHSSAVTPAAFGWSCLIIPKTPAPARVIDLDPARNRTGDVWHVWVEGIRSRSTLCLPRGWPVQPSEGHRFNFNKLLLDPFATAISRLPPGILARLVDTIRRRRSKTWCLRSSTMPASCRNAYSRQRALSTGMKTATPASVVEDGHLRNACSWLHHSSQLRRGASRHVPRPDGKDPLSQRTGSDRRGTDACAGVQ